MTLKMILSVIMIGYLFNITIAEMPMEPNIEELCENSEVIVCAEPNEWMKTITNNKEGNHDIINFKICQIYKGPSNLGSINVLIPAERQDQFPDKISGCSIIPVYVKGEKYFLFLKQKKKSNFYIRTDIDEIWGERKWDKEHEQQIIGDVKFLSDPNRWKKPGDNLGYTIPEGAEEKMVPLSEYQVENKLSKSVEYWLNGKLVGERAWYVNGQITYEEPIKDDMRHGIYRVWYPDGKPQINAPYRKGRIHGVYKQWDDKGVLIEESFYIRGKQVTKAKYLKELKNNETLPKIED
jgi:antitoxin component YwqK of YwqJK toxin-antitoxin module